MKTIALLFTIWLPALVAMAAPATKPNIVVFIADDHSQADSQAATEAKSVAFQLAAGDWRELTVELPAVGTLGILRLYLPAAKEPVELDWVELKPAEGKSQRWDF